jgi:hypothetical protein
MVFIVCIPWVKARFERQVFDARFSDFAKVGFWMALIILATNLLAVNLLWPITPLP